MKRVQLQLFAMLAASILALGLIVVLFFWPSDIAAILVRPLDGLSHGKSGVGPSPPGFWFADVTDDSGISFRHQAGQVLSDIRQVMAPGVCAGDFDGNGSIDLFVPGTDLRAETGSQLYFNDGGMRFRQFTGDGRPWSGENAMGCVAADIDNDGDLDLYVTALGPNRLYVNDGRGRFLERAERAGLADSRWSTGAAIADFDRDGRLDLYVANYVLFSQDRVSAYTGVPSDRDEPPAFSPYVFEAEGDALYRNRGDGTFEDVSSEFGIGAETEKGMGVAFADLDDDRWPDLVVINDVSPNQFYHNDSGRFTDAGLLSGLADPRSGMGVAIGDFDSDGFLDVFSSHWQDESNVLYRNLGDPQPGQPPYFEDVTIVQRLGAASIGLTGWGSVFADFDQDGDLDLVVVNGYTSPSPSVPSQCIGQPALLFVQARGRFENQSDRSGLESLAACAARGAIAADLDDDGDLDLVVTTNNGPVKIFENRVATGHYLKVRPRGQAVGCSIALRSGKMRQRRTILAGASYLSGEPLEAHFGLGDAEVVDELLVQWADGSTARRTQVRANQTLRIGSD